MIELLLEYFSPFEIFNKRKNSSLLGLYNKQLLVASLNCEHSSIGKMLFFQIIDSSEVLSNPDHSWMTDTHR
jgi:hypothetical protein